MGLADSIIERMHKPAPAQEFTVEGAPEIILAKHPSIYRICGTMYCGGARLMQGNKEQLYRLIDDPNARLTNGQAAWVFNRLAEYAPDVDDRIIVVSGDYAWDKELGRLVPLSELGTFITSNERTTKERRDGSDR